MVSELLDLLPTFSTHLAAVLELPQSEGSANRVATASVRLNLMKATGAVDVLVVAAGRAGVRWGGCVSVSATQSGPRVYPGKFRPLTS